MFDALVRCGSWCEADLITAQARAAGFQVEVRTDEVDEDSAAVFLKVWCHGNADRCDEVSAIVWPIGGALVESYGIEDDRGRLC
jgi:hypothetical protein